MAELAVLGVDASPGPGGRTHTAVAAVLAGAAEAGARTELLELGEAGAPAVIAAIEAADAIVFGSPVYRATYDALLKELLETTQRGRYGETSAPLQGKAAATVMTGASAHHFLSTGDLRNTLASFFAVQVLSPGFYAEHADYVDRATLAADAAALAAAHGAALVDLAAAVRSSAALRGLQPQV